MVDFTVNATDLDNDLVVYGTNATNVTFNATAGNFSWGQPLEIRGTYVWYFNSTDSYGGMQSRT